MQAAEYINQHYLRLDACIINRGKLLHSALSSLQNFDRSLDKFLAWLSEVESVVESLEGESESRRGAHQLKEIQADIERQATTHAALRSSNLALLGTLSTEDALMVQLRGDEMERRWQVDQHRSLDYTLQHGLEIPKKTLQSTQITGAKNTHSRLTEPSGAQR